MADIKDTNTGFTSKQDGNSADKGSSHFDASRDTGEGFQPATASAGSDWQGGSGASRDQSSGGISGMASGMASKAGEKLMDVAEQQKGVGADFVSGMADAVRNAAGSFDGQLPQAGDYIRYAADHMADMSDALRRRDVRQLVSGVENFARQQPTAFLGLTFLAGFAAVRFLRSSTQGMGQSYSREPGLRRSYGNVGMDRGSNFAGSAGQQPQASWPQSNPSM